MRDQMVPWTPTTGRLMAGDLLLQTLELPWAENVHNRSCIPLGTYPCEVSWSPRFGRALPHLLSVPERDGILIHPGNTTADTDGCVLVGMDRGAGGQTILYSRKALAYLMDFLSQEAESGAITCDVVMADVGESTA